MKFFTSIWMVIVVAAVLLGVRIDNSDIVKTLRFKTWDYFQKIQPREVISDSVTVVNISEKDLKTYGQWPWPRHVMAMLHAKIADAGAILVNYNVLFAEADRMSGVEYLKSMPMTNEMRTQLGEVLLDTDAVFSTVLKESQRAVLMMSVKNTTDTNLPSTTQIIEKGNVKPWLYEYAGIVSPHAKVSAGATGMGVNVTSPEPDAVVRKMPVLIRINGKIYPSMILENIRLLKGSKRIKVIAKEHELVSLGGQAAAAAHSLNTPLSTIKVISQDMYRQFKDQNDIKKDIELLVSQVDRCGQILTHSSQFDKFVQI